MGAQCKKERKQTTQGRDGRTAPSTNTGRRAVLPSLPWVVCFLSFLHWARDWRGLALTQVHHWSRLSDSGEDGEALSSVQSTALAVGKLIHNLLCDGRVKND